MKTKLFLIPTLALALLASSCKHGPDAETLKAVTDFETNWTSLGQQATAWSEDLTSSLAKCEECCKNNESISTEGMSMEMKSKCEEATSACKNDKGQFEAMKAEWDGFQTSWGESTAAFGAWKEKLMKGEVDAETAKKQLEELNGKMAEAKTKLETWSTALASAKESCGKNMESCANIANMAKEEASKTAKK